MASPAATGRPILCSPSWRHSDGTLAIELRGSSERQARRQRRGREISVMLYLTNPYTEVENKSAWQADDEADGDHLDRFWDPNYWDLEAAEAEYLRVDAPLNGED